MFFFISSSNSGGVSTQSWVKYGQNELKVWLKSSFKNNPAFEITTFLRAINKLEFLIACKLRKAFYHQNETSE